MPADQYDEYLRLFLKHEPDLRAFIGSVIRDHHVREDLVQDVAVVCWQQFARYDRGRSFGAWARGIAANKVRQRMARSDLFPLVSDPAVLDAVLQAFDRTEEEASPRLEALRVCVSRLPEKSRRLLEYRYGEAMRPDEIAERLKRRRDAIYKALARLRSKLEECIRRRLALEEAP